MPLPSAGPQWTVTGSAVPSRVTEADTFRTYGLSRATEDRLDRADVGRRELELCLPRRGAGGRLGDHRERRRRQHRRQRGVVHRQRQWEHRVGGRVAGDHFERAAALVAVFLQLPALDHRAARREHAAHVVVVDDDARGRERRLLAEAAHPATDGVGFDAAGADAFGAVAALLDCGGFCSSSGGGGNIAW